MSVETVPIDSSERAIRLSYAQAVLSAIYGASTGGMFITGYALRLGAQNVHIGLMSTVPMLCVVAQLFSSMLVERGTSRRALTIAASALNVGCWVLIVALPYVAERSTTTFRVGALIGIMALVSLFGQLAGNARSSWLGDLVPSHRRGTFFGKMMVYSGVIGVVFAIAEGAFLDRVKHGGIGAFTGLFLFGMVFGTLATILFAPQADVPIVRKADEARANIVRSVRQTFANRPLIGVMLFQLVWSLQSIVGMFPATYMLRDLRVSFQGLGIVTSVGTLTVLLSAPFWGRVIDRYGCRPVLIACSLMLIWPPLIWVFIDSRTEVYMYLPFTNLLAGFASAGISIALSTILFKVTEGSARTVQLAVHSIVVTLVAAPMPVLGSHLPDWLNALGFHADLRATFYAGIPFVIIAGLVARRIHEPDAREAGELLRNLPAHLARRKPLVEAAE